MKKIFLFTIIAVASLLIGAVTVHAQLVKGCLGNSVPCESVPGVGVNDDCCHCAGNEILVDMDNNGYLDTCMDRGGVIAKDPCHGQYEFIDTPVAGVCDGTSDTCCRVPNTGTRLVKDPCHGQEIYMQTCGGNFECCQMGRKVRAR